MEFVCFQNIGEANRDGKAVKRETFEGNNKVVNRNCFKCNNVLAICTIIG